MTSTDLITKILLAVAAISWSIGFYFLVKAERARKKMKENLSELEMDEVDNFQ